MTDHYTPDKRLIEIYARDIASLMPSRRAQARAVDVAISELTRLRALSPHPKGRTDD